MMRMRHASVLVFAAALAGSRTPLEASDAEAIAAAKSANVRQIEPSLPDQAFVQWLRGVAGEHAEVKWEVNDCGEQTGDPALDKGRDFPMCAEAQTSLGGNRRLSVSLSVGTFKTGVRKGPASLVSVVITEPDGSLHWVKSLSRLREAVKGAR